MHIRPATPKDLPCAAAVHSAAFRNDQLTNWLYPRLSTHPTDLQRAQALRLRAAHLARGKTILVAIADEQDSSFATPGEVIGFAVWINQTVTDEDNSWGTALQKYLLSWEVWWQEWAVDRATDWGRARKFGAHAAGQTVFDGVGKGLYLGVVGVHPKAQRNGIATALLQWGLEVAKKERIPIMLISAPNAKSLYLKAGFTQIGEVNLEDENLDPAFAMLWEP